MFMEKKLTISLVTFNGSASIRSCLEGIKQQTVFRQCELIVFDNASNDDTVSIVEQEYPEAIIVRSFFNKGFAVGHNDVIRRTRTPYILILNQDVLLESTYCAECISFLDTNAKAGSVTGAVVQASSLTPLVTTGIIDTCGLQVKKEFHHFSNYARGRLPATCMSTKEVFGIAGTAAVYRVTALKDTAVSLGEREEYFDEDFFMYKEDIDLAYRLQWRKWHAYLVPGARAYHIRTAKSAFLIANRGVRRIARWSYRNHFFLLMKNMSVGVMYRFGFSMFLYECAKFFYLCIREPYVIGALGEVFTLRKRIRQKRQVILSRRSASDAEIIQSMNV